MEIRIRLGMMKDYPSPYEDLSYDLVECKEHVDLSVEAARRSMVLLKNENNMLPLDVKKIRRSSYAYCQTLLEPPKYSLRNV